MAVFNPSKKELNDFNGGQKYVNQQSIPNADDFNNVIESALYSQDLAEQMIESKLPNVTNADNGKFLIVKDGVWGISNEVYAPSTISYEQNESGGTTANIT